MTAGRDILQIREWHRLIVRRHSWILESFNLVQVSDNIVEFVKSSVTNQQIKLITCKKVWQKLISGEAFFRLIVYHLYYIRRRRENHFLFKVDLKLYGKSESEIQGLVSTVEVFSQDIGMKFSIKKCYVITMNRKKFK